MLRQGGQSKKLIIDSATRWNSTLDMIERYLSQSTAVLSALTKLKVSSLNVARILSAS